MSATNRPDLRVIRKKSGLRMRVAFLTNKEVPRGWETIRIWQRTHMVEEISEQFAFSRDETDAAIQDLVEHTQRASRKTFARVRDAVMTKIAEFGISIGTTNS